MTGEDQRPTAESAATYLDVVDAMAGEMDPKTPCEVMPTRPCVVWNEPATHADDRYFPVARCAETCWRYRRPIPPGSEDGR